MNKTEKIYESIVLGLFVIFFSYLLYIAKTVESYSFEGLASMDFPSWIFMIVIALSGLKLLGNIILFAKQRNLMNGKLDYVDPRVYVTLGLILLYAFAWNAIGFSISTFIFVTIESKLLRKESPWKKSFLIGFVATVFMVVVFGYLFNVDFPEPLYELI
jgi:hypothetical protein